MTRGRRPTREKGSGRRVVIAVRRDLIRARSFSFFRPLVVSSGALRREYKINKSLTGGLHLDLALFSRRFTQSQPRY